MTKSEKEILERLKGRTHLMTTWQVDFCASLRRYRQKKDLTPRQRSALFKINASV